MAKELPFFKFDISAWMLGRIQKQPLEVQGAFINLCCRYWHKLGEYTFEEAKLDFGDEVLSKLSASKIIRRQGKFLGILFLDEQLNDRKQVSSKNRENGIKSAQIRATTAQRNSTTVERPLTTAQRNSTEERREEKKREEKIPPTPSIDFSFASAFSKIFNKPYPKERGAKGEGQTVDMMLRQLSDHPPDWVLGQAKAMRAVYEAEGWSMPTNPVTIINSLTETNWMERLKDSEPEKKAERKLNQIS